MASWAYKLVANLAKTEAMYMQPGFPPFLGDRYSFGHMRFLRPTKTFVWFRWVGGSELICDHTDWFELLGCANVCCFLLINVRYLWLWCVCETRSHFGRYGTHRGNILQVVACLRVPSGHDQAVHLFEMSVNAIGCQLFTNISKTLKYMQHFFWKTRFKT